MIVGRVNSARSVVGVRRALNDTDLLVSSVSVAGNQSLSGSAAQSGQSAAA